MSKVIGQGLRQQQKSLNERVTILERSQAQMMVGVQKRLIEIGQTEQDTKDFIEALARLSGTEEVQAEVKAIRIERLRAQANAEKDSLDAGIKDGFILPVDTAEEKSVIVGRYIESNGEVQEPGRAQLVMPGIQEEFRNQLLGKGPGTVLDLPNGAKFEVQELYNVDEAKYAEVQATREAAQKAAIEALQAPAPAADADDSADEAASSDEG